MFVGSNSNGSVSSGVLLLVIGEEGPDRLIAHEVVDWVLYVDSISFESTKRPRLISLPDLVVGDQVVSLLDLAVE